MGALLSDVLGVSLPEQTYGQPTRQRRFGVVLLNVGSFANLFDGRPFWIATSGLRFADDNPVKLGQDTKRRVRDLARAKALASHVLKGVGEWQDHCLLGENCDLLHVRRAMHDDELRLLWGAWPELGEYDAPASYTENARNFRTSLYTGPKLEIVKP